MKNIYHYITLLSVALAVFIISGAVLPLIPAVAEGTVGDITICGRPGTDSFNVCYYQGRNRETFKVQRSDERIDFDWGRGAPDPVLEPDHFSARWLGLFDFEEGIYEFSATMDDGMRVYVDNELIIDQWHDQPATTYTVRKKMTAGQNRGVIVEYYENTGEAVAKLSWKKINESGETTTPPKTNVQYYPSVSPSVWYILPGRELSFNGTGFAPGETVTIQGDSVNTAVTTEQNGSFTANRVVIVPFSWVSSVRNFTVTGSVSRDRATPRPITIHIGTFYPGLTPSSWWIGRGQAMNVDVNGFAPGEEVRLLVNGEQVEQRAIDSSGSASFSIVTPRSGGTAMLTAQGISTGISVSRIIFLKP